MPQLSYAYAAGKISVLETHLLKKDKYDRLLDAENIDEVEKILSETAYGPRISEAGALETAIQQEKHALCSFLEKMTPQKEISDLFLLKNDAHNLKVLFKAKALGGNTDISKAMTDCSLMKSEEMQSIVEKGKFELLPTFLAEAARAVEQEFSATQNPMLVDVIIDKALYAHAFGVLKKYNKEPVIISYFRSKVDLENIRALFRVKTAGLTKNFYRKLLLSGGILNGDWLVELLEQDTEAVFAELQRTDYSDVVNACKEEYLAGGKLVAFERKTEAFLLEKFRRARFENVESMVPLIGYFLAKESELRGIRIIMIGKRNHLPAHTIRERLCE